MQADPRLLALATAVPPYVLRQDEVMANALALFGASESEVERLLPVYANAGIDTRRSCVPIAWYLQPHGWAERHALFVENAVDLLEEAGRACIRQAGLEPEEIDSIVTVCTTGIATPSLDARLMERMPLRRNVNRLPIFGLGCAGGVLGLARAAAIARADPGCKVLFLVVELCALTFRSGDLSKSNIIATALFGDGAAAAVLSCEGDGPAITAWGEHTWPRSLDVMGWRVEEDGLGVLFSRDIPAIVRNDLRPAVEAFLGDRDRTLSDIDGFVCHPGGAKVVTAMEEALDLSAGTLDHARSVLRDFGNMSAATVMFVLDRALRNGARGRQLLCALGPGFTAGFLTLELPSWASRN
jgi:alkylresorcinol/alkylpyrone synthase